MGLLTSLADKLYLYKTKQSNSTRTRARTHTHTASTRPVLDIRLLHTWTPLWICVAERCTGNSPCTLYIYTYIQGCEVVKCCNTCLLPHHVVMITLVWNTRSQPSHVYSLALSLSSLVSGGSRMWQVVRKTDAGMLTPQPCPICDHATGGGLDGIRSSFSKDRSWWA